MRDVTMAIQRAAEIAERYVERERATPVRDPIAPEDALRTFPIRPPATGRSLDETLGLLDAMVDATPSSSSRRFLNQLFGGRDAAATAADMLACVTNTSMYTYKAAGVQVLVEQALIDHMAAKVGFAGGSGIFTPGGSLSSFAAMLVARNETLPDAREHGLSGQRPVVYTSTESHYCIRKSMGMLGMGRANLRYVGVDERGRMRPDALAAAIQQDIAQGRTPVLINATAGTTVEGAFDPIDAIADVAQRFGVWLHVDAAFGGSVALSSRHRGLLAGADRADSFCWDAHKMMGVPLTCSVAFTREPGMFTKHLDETASYLFQQDSEELNPGTRSLQCGRRNDALKLWAAWQQHGDEGYEARIDRLFDLARSLADRVEATPGLSLTKRPESVNVCFEVDGKASDEICERLDCAAVAKVGYGIVEGRRVIRVPCVNPALTEDDLSEFLDDLALAAAESPTGDNAVAATGAAC